RIFEESLRIDSSVYIFGLRLNLYIASALTVVGAVWFYRSQRRPLPAAADAGAEPPTNPGPQALEAAGAGPGEEPREPRDSGQAAPGPA
ncbi:MAG TPA: hypothetical protein VEF71_20610, partial [Streptosporangiaceae bacterium]|nr:hypothetical protein [Streptosporangiaceae bacterium]